MDLIRTRLRPPTRGAGLINRAKLVKIAHRICTRRLVFVKAPAGYGKSSLLQCWCAMLREQKIGAGWLSLDHLLLDDLRSFFQYAASAIREQLPDFGGQFLEFLTSAREPTATRVATAFLNALLELNDDIVLFIDDFHLLTDRQAICAIETVLRDAPHNFHLVIASRQSPGFSLARFRMLGEIDEIESEQLRFDADDLGQFMRLSGRAPLTDAEAASLLAATEGWAAGVQLALISLAQHEDLGPFLERFSGEHRMVSEFLLDDVVDNLPDETVNFLLKTSVLEFFNRDICDLLVGAGNAEACISDLSARSLFIFSLDDEKNWFRYHHLFSEVLQRMLRERAPDQVFDLHRKASKWYAQKGYTELAFKHAVKATDWAEAARILDSGCTNLFYEGKLSTLMRLADQIPAEILNQFPRIQLELAWSIILEWRFGDALTIIRRVESMLEAWRGAGASPETIEEVGRIVLHRRMMLALFMDDVATLEHSVLELLRDFPSSDPYLRGTLENCLIYARREMYHLDRIDEMDRRARDFFERSGSKFVFVWHEAILAPTYHLRGDAAAAREALLSAIDIAGYIEGPATPLQAMPGALLAEILYEQNDADAAALLLDRYGQLTLRLGFVDNLAAYFITSIRLSLRRGDDEQALKLLADGEACASFRGFPRLSQQLWLERVRRACRTGDLPFLRAQLDLAQAPAQKRRLSPGQHTISRDEYFALGWSIAACQTGRARDAIEVLRRWAAFTAGRNTVRSEVRFLIELACALSLAGERGEALRKMRLAVQKAARPRFISSFLDAGEPVIRLLRELFDVKQGPSDPISGFGAELLHAFAASAGGGRDTMLDPDADHMPPEALSERERDVLRLASLGKANKDIARMLGMTEGTVKWYMQQVFAKLDVRRRSLAVQRARQFGLL